MAVFTIHEQGLSGRLIASVRGLNSAQWKDRRSNTVVVNRGEVPTTRSGKEQGEIYCHEVPTIGRLYPYSNAQRMQPLSAMGFSNYVLY